MTAEAWAWSIAAVYTLAWIAAWVRGVWDERPVVSWDERHQCWRSARRMVKERR